MSKDEGFKGVRPKRCRESHTGSWWNTSVLRKREALVNVWDTREQSRSAR